MKKFLFLFTIVLPLLSFGQANKLYRKALRTVDLNEKIKVLNETIKLDPNHLDAYFLRALTKNDLGDFSGAIVDYSKIIVAKPDADSYFNRGNSRFSLKDLIGAKNDYEKACELDPNFVDAIYSLGCVKYDLEDYKGAIKDFNKVLEIAPDFPNVYMLRAASYKALKMPKQALKDYTLAIYISPNANTYYSRGVFYMDINYYTKANRDLTRSIRLNSNNTFAHFYRGASYMFLGKYQDAIRDFSNAIALDDMDFDAYLGLALTYYKINDLVKAQNNLKKAKKILNLSDNVTSSDVYENTYWYQNQYYFFVNNVNTLEKTLKN